MNSKGPEDHGKNEIQNRPKGRPFLVYELCDGIVDANDDEVGQKNVDEIRAKVQGSVGDCNDSTEEGRETNHGKNNSDNNKKILVYQGISLHDIRNILSHNLHNILDVVYKNLYIYNLHFQKF